MIPLPFLKFNPYWPYLLYEKGSKGRDFREGRGSHWLLIFHTAGYGGPWISSGFVMNKIQCFLLQKFKVKM